MSSDPIVVPVNITENFRSRFFDRFKNAAFDQLGFESGKEAFGLRIVVTIAFYRHRLAESVNVQQAAKLDRRVLAPAIGVNDRLAFDKARAGAPSERRR